MIDSTDSTASFSFCFKYVMQAISSSFTYLEALMISTANCLFLLRAWRDLVIDLQYLAFFKFSSTPALWSASLCLEVIETEHTYIGNEMVGMLVVVGLTALVLMGSEIL